MNHPAKPDLSRFGVWVRDAVLPGEAVEIEKLGYGAIWVGGSPAAELSFVEPILAQTTTLRVATGVITTWTAAPESVAESFHRIDNVYPGRFLLGIGVGHPEALTQYRKPIEALSAYLDKLDEYDVPAGRRVIACAGATGTETVGRAWRRRASLFDDARSHCPSAHVNGIAGFLGARA